MDVMKLACAEYALEQEKVMNEAKKQKKEEKKAKKEPIEESPAEGKFVFVHDGIEIPSGL